MQTFHRTKKISIPEVWKFVSTYLNEVDRSRKLHSNQTLHSTSSPHCLDSEQFLLPRSIFEPRYAVPDDLFSRKAKNICELTTSMDAMSIDSEFDASMSQNDWSYGDDSDSEKNMFCLCTCFA